MPRDARSIRLFVAPGEFTSSLSIQKQSTFAFAGRALVVAVVSGLAVKALSASNDRFTDDLRLPAARKAIAVDLRIAANHRAIGVRNMVLARTPVERVEAGSALVDRAGATMTEGVGAIRRVTDIMGEISMASAEQSSGVSQVGEAGTQMDKATQQNATLVEEGAGAAESMKQQAQQLVRAVAAFRLAEA